MDPIDGDPPKTTPAVGRLQVFGARTGSTSSLSDGPTTCALKDRHLGLEEANMPTYDMLTGK